MCNVVKVIPFVEKMKTILFSIYLDYCKLQEKYQRLVWDYNSVWDGRERLRESCTVLEQRVEELETVEKDYGRIRKFWGTDRVDSMIREMKEKEKLETELKNEIKKLKFSVLIKNWIFRGLYF